MIVRQRAQVRPFQMIAGHRRGNYRISGTITFDLRQLCGQRVDPIGDQGEQDSRGTMPVQRIHRAPQIGLAQRGVLKVNPGKPVDLQIEARRHGLLLGRRTDLGEMAQMAAVESIAALVGPRLPSLFEPNPGEVQRSVGRFAGGDRFSALAREFFARLTQRSLDYYLSRELSNHTGAGERFGDDAARSQFDDALDRHCREAARIVEAFAGGWYGKNVYQSSGLTPEAIRRFAPVAFKKIRAELRKRRDAET